MPDHVTIRFYDALNDFLTREQQQRAFQVRIDQARSVKDLVESIGIPHTEIELVIIDGESVDFSCLVKGGESISVYPAFSSLDISAVSLCQPEPLAEYRFILDNHLGKLAANLRLLGFDTLYENDYDDPQLAQVAEHDKRVLLTCDRQLLMRNQVIYGYFVRSRDPELQLLEVIRRYHLIEKQRPFSRCMACNGELTPVAIEAIEHLILPDTKKYYDEFFQCQECRKIYWKGSHYLKMKQMLENINNDSVYT